MSGNWVTEVVHSKLSGLRQLARGHLAVLLGLVLACLAVSVVLGPADKPHLEFLEGGLVTWMSGGFMALTSVLAFACVLVYPQGLSRGRLFWLLLAGAFGFFFLDEFLQIHERAGNLVARSIMAAPEGVRNWNDLFVIGYGLAGLATAVAFLPELLKRPLVAKQLGIGFAFYVVHTAIDSLTAEPTSSSMILEESAKVYAALFFCIAAYSGLVSLSAGEPGIVRATE